MAAAVYPEHSAVEAGVLSVGGCDALELAREFGTPAYVVAEDDLRARARAFTQALRDHHGARGEIVYASKAFPCTAVLRLFAEEGLAVDVASGGELHLALRAGLDPARLYLHGNAKSEAELRMALEAGVGTIVLDNEQDAERLQALGGGGARVLLRVTPGVDADTHEYILTGQAGSKFGMTPEAARRIAGRLDVAGLHMHIGSQLRSLDPYRRAIAALARSVTSTSTTSAAASPSRTSAATRRRRRPTGSRAWSRRRTPSSARTARWCWSRAARSSPPPA